MIRKIFPPIIKLTLAIVVAFGLSGCQSSDTDITEPIPTPISDFVQRYFPGQEIADFGSTPSGGYRLKLAQSAAITFSSTYSWMSVNGYGSSLPEMLLFDQLPPALYEYVQNLDSLGQVFAVSRDSRAYTLDLLDTTVIYDIATAQITQR